jgi:hypothetical protein
MDAMSNNSYFSACHSLRPATDRHTSPRKAAREKIAPELARLSGEGVAALPAAPSKLAQLEALVKAGRVGDPLAGVAKENAPHPDPLPAGGEREQTAAAAAPSLLDRVRHIYENTIVPVREIARLVGVSERTLYKYVARYGWRRRHVCLEAGPLPEPAPASGRSRPSSTGYAGVGKVPAGRRGQRPAPRPGFARAKGAGGRFIAFEERGAPQALACGPKALDPLAAEAAGEMCAQAGALSNAAVAQALAETASREADARAAREAEADVRTLAHLTRAMRELTRLAIADEQRERDARAEEVRAQAAAAAEQRRVEALRAELARKLENLVAGEQERERREAEAARVRAAHEALAERVRNDPNHRPIGGPRIRKTWD